MNYYKILRDGVVVDANNVFLKWQAKHKTLMVCQPEDGQFIQSSDQSEVYRVVWLHPAPEEVASQYTLIEAREIDKNEYLRIRALLDEGEQPEEEQPVIEPEQEPQKQEPTETVLSIDEMRRELSEMKKQNEELAQQNEMLTECLLEISEIVYG